MTVYGQISLDRSDPFGYVFRFSGELRGGEILISDFDMIVGGVMGS